MTNTGADQWRFAGNVHHVKPVRPAPAVGLVATVYSQLRDEFLVAPLFTLHSPVPEILAGVWAVVLRRSSAGGMPRAHKEAVASAVSRLNECPFCVDAEDITDSSVRFGPSNARQRQEVG